METTDITAQILREIRDRIGTFEQSVYTRFDLMTERFERLEMRADHVDARLERIEGRLVGVETEITGLRRDFIRLSPIGDGDGLVKRVSRCERDIAELKQRLDDPRR